MDDEFNPDTWEGFNGHLFDPVTLEMSGHGINFGDYTLQLR
jgi:hypothetical protein